MAALVRLGEDFDGPRLRDLAKRTRDASLLALAEVYDGHSRGEAAQIPFSLDGLYIFVMELRTFRSPADRHGNRACPGICCDFALTEAQNAFLFLNRTMIVWRRIFRSNQIDQLST